MTTTPVATVTFTRADGAELAFVPPRLLERPAGETAFRVLRVIEGTREHRLNVITAEALARGYVPHDAPGSEAQATPVRGAYVPPDGGKRLPLIARRAGAEFHVREEHRREAAWHVHTDLAHAITAAIMAAGADLDVAAVAALATRLQPRLQG